VRGLFRLRGWGGRWGGGGGGISSSNRGLLGGVVGGGGVKREKGMIVASGGCAMKGSTYGYNESADKTGRGLLLCHGHHTPV